MIASRRSPRWAKAGGTHGRHRERQPAAVFAATALSFAPLAHAAPGTPEDIAIEMNAAGDAVVSWTGEDGRTYFPQATPDLREDWFYIGHIYSGTGAGLAHGFASNADMLFFRLRHTDTPADDPEAADFDGDGVANADELALGTDPLGAADADSDGVADEFEVLWGAVPSEWKEAMVGHADAEFYDPEGNIDSPSDLSPIGDYDGDGRANLVEYVEGTDPADFFNGVPAYIRALGGDAQTAAPRSSLADYLRISVVGPEGGALDGAPVRFAVEDGHAGLSRSRHGTELFSAIVASSTFSGVAVAFETPGSLGKTSITASLPNGESLAFAVYTVEAAAKARGGIEDFEFVEHGDGTRKYSWKAEPAAGDFFKLQNRREDGTWEVFYETTYGSDELPYQDGQSQFTLTIAAP